MDFLEKPANNWLAKPYNFFQIPDQCIVVFKGFAETKARVNE